MNVMTRKQFVHEVMLYLIFGILMIGMGIAVGLLSFQSIDFALEVYFQVPESALTEDLLTQASILMRRVPVWLALWVLPQYQLYMFAMQVFSVLIMSLGLVYIWQLFLVLTGNVPENQPGDLD